MNMRIVLASDHAAIDLRKIIGNHVQERGWDVVDIGPVTAQSTPYPEQGVAAANRVISGECAYGIVLCGTGQGIMIAANKVKGIRCGVCAEPVSARLIREHNDANMLAIGARIVGQSLAKEIVDAFLNAKFEGGRHLARVDLIKALER